MKEPQDQAKSKKPYVQPDLVKSEQLKKITEGVAVSVGVGGNEPQ